MVESGMKKVTWRIENGQVFHAKEGQDRQRDENRVKDFLAQKEQWGVDSWDWVRLTSHIKWGLSMASLGDGNREWQRKRDTTSRNW